MNNMENTNNNNTNNHITITNHPNYNYNDNENENKNENDLSCTFSTLSSSSTPPESPSDKQTTQNINRLNHEFSYDDETTDNFYLNSSAETISSPISPLNTSRDIINCLICLDEIQNYTSGFLPCGCCNKFHEECLYDWVLISGICPICRRGPGVDNTLNENEIMPNFVSYFYENTNTDNNDYYSNRRLNRIRRQHVEIVEINDNYPRCCFSNLNRQNQVLSAFLFMCLILLTLRLTGNLE